jgi:aspartate/methionine/tyrosine aminotransferase
VTDKTLIARLNPHFASVRRTDYKTLQDRIAEGYVMLGWADPFFPDPCLPEHVISAAKRALDQHGAHYSLPIGSLALRREIAAKLAARNGLEVDPDREVIVTPGSDAGLWQAMQVVLSPGDEVLNPVPSYPNNCRNAELMGAISVPVPLDLDRDFELDVSAVRARITPKTKLIVLTQPNNPTGTVHRRKTLERLAALVLEHDLLAVVDQAFEDTVYDGRELVTFATLPGMRARTISVFSMSKGMAMSGFRVGYSVAAPEIMEVMHATAVSILGATNTAAQEAAIAALRDRDFVEGYIEKYERRRKFAADILGGIPGVRFRPAQAGLMIWLDISGLGTSWEVSDHLLRDVKVLVHPGEFFGGVGANYIRLMLSALRDDEAFRGALERTAASLRRLPVSRVCEGARS